MDMYVKTALEQGIEAVWRGLEKEIGRPLALWRGGVLRWPRYDGFAFGKMLPHALPDFEANEYYYQQEAERLYFRYGRGAQNYLEIARTGPEEIPFIVQAYGRRRQAMELFDAIACRADAINEGFQQEMIEKIIRSSARIQEIFGFYGLELKQGELCRILLGRSRDGKAGSSGKELAGVKGWQGPLAWNGRLLFVVPGQTPGEKIEKKLVQWQDEKGGPPLLWGLGGSYELKELHRSYLEASLAWGHGSAKGEGFLWDFSALGLEGLLFTGEIRQLRSYVQKTFQGLWENDSREQQHLFATLERMLENDFNLVKTASDLYLHVNTIRYRWSKIEKVLGANLSASNVRANLMAALSLWRALKAAELLED